jgi:hypothetical protein
LNINDWKYFEVLIYLPQTVEERAIEAVTGSWKCPNDFNHNHIEIFQLAVMIVARRIIVSASNRTVRRFSQVGEKVTNIVSQSAADGKVVEGLIAQMVNPVRQAQVITSVIGFIHQKEKDCDRELRAVKAAHDKALSRFHIR